MKYSVELGICEAFDGGDTGSWYTLTERVDVEGMIVGDLSEHELEGYLLHTARLLIEQELAVGGARISFAHTWLYSYEQVEEEPA